MADLQAALSEAVKLNRSIIQFLKFSTYTDYDDLSGLDMDRTDGEQILLWEELRRITDQLADVQEYISYLTRPITEVSRLRKGTAGKYWTAKGHYPEQTGCRLPYSAARLQNLFSSCRGASKILISSCVSLDARIIAGICFCYV